MSQWRTGIKTIPIFASDFSLIADKRGTGLPRQVLPGRFCTLSRRCLNCMFLLRPDEQKQQLLVLPAFGVIRFNFVIIATCAVSNHHTTSWNVMLPALLVRSQIVIVAAGKFSGPGGAPSEVVLLDPGISSVRWRTRCTNPVKDFSLKK